MCQGGSGIVRERRFSFLEEELFSLAVRFNNGLRMRRLTYQVGPCGIVMVSPFNVGLQSGRIFQRMGLGSGAVHFNISGLKRHIFPKVGRRALILLYKRRGTKELASLVVSLQGIKTESSRQAPTT